MNTNLHLAIAHDRQPALLASAARHRLVREATAADQRRRHFRTRRARPAASVAHRPVSSRTG